MSKKIVIITFSILLFQLFFCSKKTEVQVDTATYGEINMAADESFQSIIQAQLGVFNSEYIHAKINTFYTSEGIAFKQLINDSVRFIAASRLPNENELNYFKNKNVIPKIHKIATDAIAIIVSKKNQDSLLTMEQLENIITGKYKNWKEINSKSKLENITVVFDNNNSSNLQLLKSKFNITTFTSNVASAGNNEKVIDFLQLNPNAIGIIGANCVSDIDDPKVKEYLSKVRIVGLSKSSSIDSLKYISPYQGEISLQNYPLTRNIYLISREAKTGLGTGFISFVMGERGQRIILKAGLVPVIMPNREIIIKKGMP